MVFASKVSSLLSKASKYRNESFRLQGKELQKRMGKVLLGRILVLALGKNELKFVETSCYTPLKWRRHRMNEAKVQTTKISCKRPCHCRPGSGWRGLVSITWPIYTWRRGCYIPRVEHRVVKPYDLLVKCPSREGSTRL
jgi:hypothetical protein